MKGPRTIAVVLGITLLGAIATGCDVYRLPADTQVLRSFGAGTGASLPRTLSVLVWNVHKGRLQGWSDDLLRLGPHADLLLLQEAVTSEEMVAVLRSLPGVRWDLAASFEFVRHGYATGVLTGSRTTPAAVEYVRGEGREPLTGTPKMALLTRHALDGDETALLAVNVHGHLAVPAAAFAAQMQRIAERVAPHRGPVLWAGDFNTWSAARLRTVRRLAGRLGLAPVRIVPEGRTRFLGNVLDHAFVRDLEILSARALTEIDSSDHVPFRLELKVRAAAAR